MNVNHTPLVDVITSKLANLDPKWILDVGCGGGEVLNLLARHTGILHRCFAGIDINYNAITKSTTNNNAANIKYLNADGHYLPFRDDTFDLVITTGVLEHVKSYLVVITEIRRVLKNGGVAFIACGPNRKCPIDSSYHKKTVSRYPHLPEIYKVLEPLKCKNLWHEVVARRIEYSGWHIHHHPRLYHRIFNLLQKMSKSSMIGKTFCILAKLLEKLGYQRNIVILYQK